MKPDFSGLNRNRIIAHEPASNPSALFTRVIVRSAERQHRSRGQLSYERILTTLGISASNRRTVSTHALGLFVRDSLSHYNTLWRYLYTIYIPVRIATPSIGCTVIGASSVVSC
jgi:hypothetical protein